MPRFAANLSTLFTEWKFLDRFAAAADCGFDAVEFQFAGEHRPEAIQKALERERQTLVLFNAPPGELAAGERGFAALPDRFDDFRASIAEAKIYAEHTGATAVHVMAGLADPGDPSALDAYRRALSFAVERLEGVDVLIEPLNLRDNPGYFLHDFAFAARVIGELALPRLKLQYDIHHRQILQGDVTGGLAALMPIIGHVQIASAPARGEPGSGELNDGYILSRLDALGYAGHVGCEYRPLKGTLAGLGWLDPWRRGRDAALASTWREKL